MTDEEKKEFEEFLKWKSEKQLKEGKTEQPPAQSEKFEISDKGTEADKAQEQPKVEMASTSPQKDSSVFKPLLFLLIIVGIVIFFIIGLSNNKDSSSSFSDDIVEVVDSAAIENEFLESQKNYISQAQRDSIYNAMKGDFIIKKDEFLSSGASWVEPKTKPKYRNQNAVYCCFLINNDKTVYNMRFVLQYEADSWLFIENCVFNIDGNNITYTPYKVEHDNNSRIWEWFDELVDNHNISIVRKIANAKNVKIKLNGRQYYDTRTVKAKDIASMKKILDFYEALGGTY